MVHKVIATPAAVDLIERLKAKHGPGCGCCSSKKPSRLVKQTRSGAKSFPTARPWMISH